MRVAFLVQDLQLSGGVGVVVEHASQLNRHHGFDARLVVTRPQDRPAWGYRGLADVPVMDLAEAAATTFDLAVATWWETTAALFDVDAARHVYFVQLLEDSTYLPDSPSRVAAGLTTALPVRFLTEARWIAETLEALQPGATAKYVRNGIAKDVFVSPSAVAPAPPAVPLRIVIEGSQRLPHKGVAEALQCATLMREPRHVTLVTPHPGDPGLEGADRVLSAISHAEMADLLSESHVMLKLTRVEGMYGPPLEAFHMGATVVTTPVTGHDEYVEHGWNGLVAGWDDPHGTAAALDGLARDRSRLHFLRRNALDTARAWPSWEQSAQFMAVALRAIAAEPPPDGRAAARLLVSDLATQRAELERWRAEREIGLAVVAEMRAQRAWRWSLAVRRRYHRVRAPFGAARRRLRP